MMPPLQAGDVCLYSGTDLIDRAIRLKTWSRFSHCEGYVGDGTSVASRNGIGVGRYPFRPDVAAVLRPLQAFDAASAMRWFGTVNGEGYDWLGLFAFFVARWNADPGKMFCSEFLTRWQRAGGVHPFADDYDADQVSPGLFMTSTAYLHLVP